MDNVILVIHLLLALAIIGLVLLQRSEGGGLGIGGGGGGLGGLATPKGTANLLTRATAICAGLFFCTSLILGILAGSRSEGSKSILDRLDTPSDSQPVALEIPDISFEGGADGAASQQIPLETEPSAPIAE